MKPFYSFLLCTLFLSLSNQSNAANRFWVANTPSNWNNTANWSAASGGAGGASIPGAADAVTFNNKGIGNCTLDIGVSIKSITVTATFTGRIIQGANSFSTTNNASFAGGTFSGGSANITIGGNFTLSGMAFTSTTAILEFDGNSAFTSGSFAHNNGTVRYNATGNTTISGTSPALNILEFAGKGFTYNITSAGAITVAGSLNLTGTLSYKLNTGTIDVTGDINSTNTAAGCSGSALVNIDGTGTQHFNGSGSAGEGALPQLTINKASGALDLANFPASSNNFTYTAGTVNPGSSTYCFTDGTTSPYTISGSLSFNNITFLAITNAVFTIPAATTLTAAGNFTMAGTSKITLNTGNININGDIVLTNTATNGGGSATMNILGTANETMDGTSVSAGQNLLPFIVINKTGGTLTLKGNISANADWTYTSGTVNATSFSSTVSFGNSLNVTSAGMSFYNFSVTSNTVTLVNDLTVNNNITITAGKIVPGSNTVNIAGNWSDYGTAGFTEATSTVNFNGSAVQTVASPGGENFTNLVLNNSGGGIQLLNSTAIATTLTMTQGNIDLNGNALTLGTSAANNGTLNYTNGTMINTGSFARWFKAAAITGTAGLFPMGTVTDYRPFFVSSTASPTSGGTITLAYTDATTNTATAFADGASTVLVRKDLNWNATTGNGLAGGTYNLQVQGTGLGQIGNVADLRLTLANSVVGTAGANAGTTADPQINRTGLTFANLTNSFFVGSVNSSSSPLPITLLSFTGSVIDGQVLLNWATATQTNNAWFTIQRSTDGRDWTDLQQIAGAGTNSVTTYYSAKDPSPIPGLSYYRLQQTDLDGKQSYSSILALTVQDQISGIRLYPIPAKDHITISFASPGSYEVMLFNSSGQMARGPVAFTGASQVLNTSGLGAGIYFIRIVQGAKSETRAVLIER